MFGFDNIFSFDGISDFRGILYLKKKTQFQKIR